jgi:RES domain-containing protein
LRFQGTCFRGHDPKWAFSPLSGDGARSKGGRFNPIGMPALYLALTVEGLVLEMSHGFAHRFEPLTICSYDVDVDDIVDLRTDADRKSASVDLADMACAWELDVSNGIEPASWRIAKRFIAKRAAGILVPSFAEGAAPHMHNLVLWNWGPRLPHQLNVNEDAYPGISCRGVDAFACLRMSASRAG